MPVESRDDLAPCPFCGGTEISFGRLNNAGHLFAICNDCHARASAGESHADASKNWNTRPDAKRIAELEAAFLQSQTDLQNAIGDRDEAIIQQTFAEDRAIIAERALAEERERCAQVALSFAKRDIHHYHAIKIATAIRAGKPANGE